MAERNRPHLMVPRAPITEPFTLSGAGGGGKPEPFGGDRVSHGRHLQEQLERALAAENAEEDRGTYVSFISFPGLELALGSLESQAKGDQPELLAVTEQETATGFVQIATVYIPDGKRGYFLDRLAQYVETASSTGKARNAGLIEGIQSIRRATIRELWTDSPDQFPTGDAGRHWWEVWLRDGGLGELQRFATFAEERELQTSEHYLGFGGRTVLLLHASLVELAEAFSSLDDIAELRRPHDVASVVPGLSATEQAEWADDLKDRVQAASEPKAPAVCILDTGVQEQHPLLADSLSSTDVHVADPGWQPQPVVGHGTEMAGIALYGDVHVAVVSSHSVLLRHRLESVKILPDVGENDRDLYGAITARSVDRPEIEAADRPRVFMLAITVERPRSATGGLNGQRIEAGKPTSWSATIDALAYGRAIDDSDAKFTYLDRDEPRTPRLFVVSAGNIRDLNATDDHLERSDLEPVEDPAQAWNALTVGAYTELDDMSGAHPDFNGYTPISPRGELSPVSRTSVVFERKKWPFKPDVVAEGGNVAASPAKTSVETPENLALLTTRLQKPGQGYFTTSRDTSAATAQVAAIAADLRAEYPALRLETIRALILHSAEWSSAMIAKLEAETGKAERVSLLRRYGMGVPDSSRALYSASDALTLVAEAQIHPYERENNAIDGKVREMNLHELPWPHDELEALGETPVRLRITLSYFVEPNPSSRGWTGRYVYPSHGLRFAMRRPEDSVQAFRQRINTRARTGSEKPTSLATEKGWMFGSDQQHAPGSIHTDIWLGSAVDLANKGAVAIYPVAGWWKNRRNLDQSDQGVDYSLVVSIESPEVDVDLWTPVAQQIAPEIAITT
jgi:hypothetical protein